MILHKCDNCGYITLSPKKAKDLEQRVDAEGMPPSGECDECGALCYPMVVLALPYSVFWNMVNAGSGVYLRNGDDHFYPDLSLDDESRSIYFKWIFQDQDFAISVDEDGQHIGNSQSGYDNQPVVFVEDGEHFWFVDSEGEWTSINILQNLRIF
jgi:hypothetical protein